MKCTLGTMTFIHQENPTAVTGIPNSDHDNLSFSLALLLYTSGPVSQVSAALIKTFSNFLENSNSLNEDSTLKKK